MMPLWGKPLIGHLLDLLARWGVEEILINLHFHPSPICEYLKKEPPAQLRVSFSFEPEILGTGGVLHRAGWFLDKEPFWMVNADIAADLTPFRLLAALRRRKTIASLWMDPERGPLTVEMQKGKIVNFQTSRPGTEGTYTFCGLQLISSALLKYIPSASFCSIIQAYQNAIQDGWIVRGVCLPDSYWADLGTPESYLKSHAELQERYRQGLAGRNLFNPRQIRRLPRLRKSGALISGFAAIDKTAEIRPGARIENAVIWRRTVIGPQAIVKNAVIGSECEINGRVPRLAVKPSFNEQYSDIQLNLALARLKLDPAQAAIMPFDPRGSARSFTRITGGGQSYIMIRYSREPHENCLYARHAVFLKKTGLNVPAVIADFPKQQFVIMQDLGDISLQQIAANSPGKRLGKYYHRVLKAIVLLHSCGANNARREHLEMVPSFSPDLYRWEREFFGRFFLRPHLHLRQSEIGAIMKELSEIGNLLNRERQVLIHRDLQSSNIIFFRQKPYLIDFQGMRFGPAAYDLAALLCDPYISLTAAEQCALLDYYNRLAGKGTQISPAIFWRAGVQRLGQALGAYGRLAANAETKWFAQYIPPAIKMMRRVLEEVKVCGRLAAVIAKATPD
jgi:NDP-sugar pyrophosphorylase family protein/tRNA A-37 threonylcarbamoyl transferase component Bud32